MALGVNEDMCGRARKGREQLSVRDKDWVCCQEHSLVEIVKLSLFVQGNDLRSEPTPDFFLRGKLTPSAEQKITISIVIMRAHTSKECVKEVRGMTPPLLLDARQLNSLVSIHCHGCERTLRILMLKQKSHGGCPGDFPLSFRAVCGYSARPVAGTRGLLPNIATPHQRPELFNEKPRHTQTTLEVAVGK